MSNQSIANNPHEYQHDGNITRFKIKCAGPSTHYQVHFTYKCMCDRWPWYLHNCLAQGSMQPLRITFMLHVGVFRQVYIMYSWFRPAQIALAIKNLRIESSYRNFDYRAIYQAIGQLDLAIFS